MTLSELIARLEAAPEGSRELDGDIAEIAGQVPVEFYLKGGQNHGRVGGLFLFDPPTPDGRTLTWVAPIYTTSLDAALPWEKIYSVGLLKSDQYEDGIWEAWHISNNDVVRKGCARTEALARRIAALKAMEGK